MRRSLVAALITVAGCLSPPPPEYRCSHGEGVSFAAGAPQDNICPSVDRVHAAGAQVCSSAGKDISGVSILVEGKDFECGGRMVHGCAIWPSAVDVRDEKLLPDEMGHLVWYSCYGRSGEQTLADGGVAYDPDFKAWVDSLSE